MTENSTDKTSAAGFLLLLLFLVIAALAYFCQAESKMEYEGVYPVVRPKIQGQFIFNAHLVEVKLQNTPVWKRIVVFAYDAEGRQVGIIKPVYNRTLTITEKDYPDFRVKVRDGKAEGFEIVNRANGGYENKGFLTLLAEAKDASRRYGVQECLYPMCTRCMDVCPVVKFGIVEIPVTQSGAFYPVIHIQGCPRCGKCFEVCKIGLICKPNQVDRTRADTEDISEIWVYPKESALKKEPGSLSH